MRGRITDYRAAVAYLDDHIGAGVRLGLERISAILELMGDPQQAYPIIHVAGTNGKTSTVRMAAALLAAHGLRVGSTTSPHLERVEERFQLDLEPAAPEAMAEAVADVAPFVDLYEAASGMRPTYFELTAATAFAYFAAHAVDVAAVEVGLGGRWDATNAADATVAVVTGVGLDHTEYLGPTIADIAAEKLAIAKPGSVLVTGSLPPEAAELAAARAADLGILHRRSGVDFSVVDARRAVGGWLATITGVYETYEDLYLPLHGRHQLANLAVATASVEELFGRALDPDAVRAGCEASTSPGRLELVSVAPLVMLDGAHNPAGFAVMAAALDEEFPSTEWVVVLGAMADKDLPAMLLELEGKAVTVIATAVDDPRAVPPAEVAATASEVLGVPARPATGVAGAVDEAIELAGPAGAVLVTGSLYLVGAARTALGRRR